MKDQVVEGLDHRYKTYYDYFRLHCYENRDEIDIPPEQAASILAYGYMGEWNDEADSGFIGDDPLSTAIGIVAEREGREGSIDYESGGHPSRSSLERKAATIEEDLESVKKKLQREYEVRDR